MEKRKSSKPPKAFGCSVKRFDTLGLHPELITTNNSNPTAPDQYHPHVFKCKYKEHFSSWQKKVESEEFSKYLGFRIPHLLADRKFDETLRGPGSLDPYEYEKNKGASSFDDVGFSMAPRFVSFIKDNKLPPGAHNVKQPRTKFSETATFEWSGADSRFKNTEPKYRLAPNRYTVPYDHIVRKAMSKRGPYDTFTGPRDETTIKNHFAPAMFKSPDVLYRIPNATDLLLRHPSKRRNGKFLQALRFPPGATVKATKNGFSMYEKDQDYPGPATYDAPPGINQKKQTIYPFNSSNINARPPINWKIHPGPDRYFIKYPTCHKMGQRKSWMFLSKVNRGLDTKESYSIFVYNK